MNRFSAAVDRHLLHRIGVAVPASATTGSAAPTGSAARAAASNSIHTLKLS